ncbi:plasmid mobilization relaxosome protein MobC, partial [Enterococcus sp. DIV2381]
SAGHGTLNNYILEMVLAGRVVHIDFEGLKESLAPIGSYAQELNKIGGNMNQIAKHMNEAGIDQQQVNFFVEEFAKMKQNYDQAQGELIKELHKIRKL